MKYILLVLWSLLLTATSVTAQSNYRIKPGDTITVEVLEDASLNRSILVLPDGSISFPFAGSVPVSGRTVPEVQQAITSGIAGNFAAAPTVFVSVSAVRPAAPSSSSTASISVYFVGEVNDPGLRPLTRGTTFLQAVAQSGGFTRFAATKRVQLRRLDRTTGQQSIFTMNFKALGDGEALSNDITLMEGDVILVPERRLFE
ncbi:polysaccharide biosynthesis/export family protein [Roseobacter weihaiensis]|uniref:polysaccharide biosynthesis/export family protein n=1 Tax=Roseobacter weihaiensis TaxID=2763262 RepID=UPI001D09E5DA|nr:polysaccharide biosynthesis/export family protein [Roseobacter sp. H9]